MNKRKSLGCFVVLTILLVIGLIANLFNSDINSSPDKASQKVPTVSESSSQGGEVQEERLPLIYDKNKNINLFINNYNGANSDQITAERFAPYYHNGSTHDNQILFEGTNELNNGFEVVISDNVSEITVVINGTRSDVNKTNEEIKSEFLKFAKGFDKSLNDEKLNGYWQQLLDATIYSVEFDEFEVRLNMLNDTVEYLTIEGKVR